MKEKVPFYFKDWFIIVCSALWPAYGVSLIIAIILVILKKKKYSTLNRNKFEEYISKYQSVEQLDEKHKSLIENFNNNLNSLKEEQSVKISDFKKELKKLNDEHRLELEESKNIIKSEIKFLNKKKKEIQYFINENTDKYLEKQTFVEFDDNVTSDEIKNQLAMHKLKEKDAVKALVFSKKYNNTETNKQLKQLIRSFNTETDYYISNVSSKNIDRYRDKIMKSYENLNKLFEVDGVKLDKDYLKLKLSHLSIVYQYQIKKETERELLRAQKEEIREQQRVEKELEDERRKLEKEEQQFNNEINKMMSYLNKSNSDVEREIYAEKIKDLENKLKKLETDKENVRQRQTNTRAGFVYIISNIGSFGENIFKIGMTRRLEPMDRINELGSASVPFKFDVHALIFSEDAPALETLLHNHFRNREVNKVNSRKEFFNVNLSEIKSLIHEKFDKTVTFYEEPEALEYRESLRKQA
ncbi:DUF4041 domain-containing protein [Facklamia miroungae]|uniref:T5orf172 domain-containing protein n=1 Tax=Facklamia miroungae TaxID=120956 RepID=A0A1G7NXN9_9LACT|nr:DUF4041 domain-containing protein [Facklamia miroungae]NKZ28506.1 DUF4041 domain-containing protein [Facklamia miroungae]SDF78753.1 T5orf172 domain-containing protein [Facklamia miroungae]